MKKSHWKERAVGAEEQVEQLERWIEAANSEAYGLRRQIAELNRELEDKRKNWTPIKIKHSYEPRDSGCRLCDDPREDPRHG